MKKQLFLHIGTHKTASTSIQEALTLCLEGDNTTDFLFPKSCRSNTVKNHSNIAWEMSRDDRFNPDCGGVQDLINECRSSDKKKIIVSGEEMEFLEQKSIDELGALLKKHFRISVIAYIRRQDEFIRSEYTEWVKQGLCFDNFSTFWRGHAMHIRYDYGHLLEKWRNTFGADNVLFRPFGVRYLRGGDPIMDFFDLCGLHAGDRTFRNVNRNTAPTAWSVAAMRLALHYYELLKGEESNFVAHLRHTHDYASYDYRSRYQICSDIEKLADRYDTEKRRFIGFAHGEQRECIIKFAPINDRFLGMLKKGEQLDFQGLFAVPVGTEVTETPVTLSKQACSHIFRVVRRLSGFGMRPLHGFGIRKKARAKLGNLRWKLQS